ncbi:MAG: 16S rRNA (adenine(1518)-N(6)/adenine(1519)-N(6))-dimethyltransferase RsmA [Acidimicrobiia bacterium]|nr:16S rRNA (adenine(1518)-N(6)/adenine(1519)-N(6))-dimethyltransferase RsmA [Acidimicrobiia bacterium]
MTRQGPAEIRRLLDDYGLEPSKALGQNFLADPNIVERIVRTAEITEGDNVLEVGPGTGTLTHQLIETGANVVAVEFDRGLARMVSDLFGDRATVIQEDIMKVDLDELLGERRWTLVANLPYNVGTSLVLDVLRHHRQVERLVVMVQREVAERLCASPGSKVYGLPSVVAGLHATSSIAFFVPPQVFIPVPDVQSAVVDIKRINNVDPAADRAVRLAESAFQQRRKMIRRSLSSASDDPSAWIAAAGLDPTSRAERLSPADYLELARALPE